MVRMGAKRLTIVLGLALWTSGAVAQQPRVPPVRTPATPAPADAPCARYDLARNAAMAAAIKTVLAELPERGEGGDPAAHLRALEPLYQRYEERARAGEIEPLRKLTAIELFLTEIRREPTRDLTQRKACFLANVPERMRSMIDSVACAVILLEPARRLDDANRAEARRVMDEAARLVPADANAASIAKILHDDVSRGLEGCYAAPSQLPQPK